MWTMLEDYYDNVRMISCRWKLEKVTLCLTKRFENLAKIQDNTF